MRHPPSRKVTAIRISLASQHMTNINATVLPKLPAALPAYRHTLACCLPTYKPTLAGLPACLPACLPTCLLPSSPPVATNPQSSRSHNKHTSHYDNIPV
ncbi:hypothetical protein E2C01_037127 [Portunus trituberculatus]|uniref:Uncharacterized protein n=1 Tax=Portunus trituberculatus TaxID=210409 RepID=A0A5B7FEI5_PORTR|nr:hypothetical protein [Portunus trituberculatus]